MKTIVFCAPIFELNGFAWASRSWFRVLEKLHDDGLIDLYLFPMDQNQTCISPGRD